MSREEKNCELFKKVDSDFFKYQRDKYEQSVASSRIATINADINNINAADFPPISSTPLMTPKASSSMNNVRGQVNSVFGGSQQSGSKDINYYNILNQDVDDTEIITDSRPSKPKLSLSNPWSQVVRQRVQKRKIGSQHDPPKRRAASIVRANMPSTSTSTASSTSSGITKPPGLQNMQPDTCTDTLMSTLSQVIAQVFTAMNIPDHWRNLCLTLLPIVFGAIKAYLSTSSNSSLSSPNATQNV